MIDACVVLAGGSLSLGGVLALVPGSLAAPSLRLGIGVVLFSALYFTIAHGSTGQTLGKRRARASRCAMCAAAGRSAIPGRSCAGWHSRCSSLLTVVLVVDLLFPLWDDRHQALHDKVASSSRCSQAVAARDT